MDSFEWNKIFGGLLGALLFVLLAQKVSDFAFYEKPLEQQAIKIDVPEAAAPAGDAPEEPEVDFAALLQNASVDGGERVSKQCTSCHSFEKGGANKIGPNLYNIVGADIASRDGYGYSAALSDAEGDWTYAALNGFLEAPREWVPGTSMGYAGLSRPKQRADLIAYLRANTDNPPPLPEPES